jgi:hypothetical protein
MTIPANWKETTQERAYEDLRPQVQNGDLLLFSSNMGFSRLIEWATGSAWSHVGLIYRMPEIDRLIVLESIERVGVHAVALSKIVDGDARRMPYPGTLLVARHEDFSKVVNSDALRKMSQFAVDRFGDPYAIGEVYKIAFRILLGVAPLRLPKLLSANDEFICSEYVARCYDELGLTFAWNGRGFLAPADIARDPKISVVAAIKNAPRPAKDDRRRHQRR